MTLSGKKHLGYGISRIPGAFEALDYGLDETDRSMIEYRVTAFDTHETSINDTLLLSLKISKNVSFALSFRLWLHMLSKKTVDKTISNLFPEEVGEDRKALILSLQDSEMATNKDSQPTEAVRSVRQSAWTSPIEWFERLWKLHTESFVTNTG